MWLGVKDGRYHMRHVCQDAEDCIILTAHFSDQMKEYQMLHIFSFYVADEGDNALSLGRSVTEIHEKSLLAFGSRSDVSDWELHLKSTVIS